VRRVYCALCECILYTVLSENEHTIHNFMDNVDEHLELKMSKEENSVTNYLDLSINRNASNIDLCIYRKPTYIDITIH